MDIPEPRVTKRERKLHISYELPERLHCCCIYPLTGPNGSTIVLYGHEGGLRVLWRGGRRPRKDANQQHSPQQTNGVSKSREINTIDDDKDGPQQDRPDDDDDTYEAEEDEQDPDCPYPLIIEDLDVYLSTDVLSVAVPTITPSASQNPALIKNKMIIAVGCADGRIILLTMPLRPPPSATKYEFFKDEYAELQLQGAGNICYDLSIKVLEEDEGSSAKDDSVGIEGRLLVASASRQLCIWNLKFTRDKVLQDERSLQPMVTTAVPGFTVSFQTSSRSNQLLLSDRTGAVRIYDLPMNERLGRWLTSYLTPFFQPKDGNALPRRKKILDASWILSGRGIIVLLENGEWGIWDLSGTQSGKSVEDFALRGFLGSSNSAEISEFTKQKRGGSKLAPMTPNTRKTNSEKLFSGSPKVTGVAPAGGISVNATSNRSGQVDERVILWYGSDIYSIPSLHTFWQRSTSSTGGAGSLYAPGLTQITDVNLMNEKITSISQFATGSTTRKFGQMNTHRDLLVSAEHRFIVLQHLRSPIQSRDVFQPEERPTSRDQRMLDAGNLDLRGMDRMLDNMADNGRTRRVGFAH